MPIWWGADGRYPWDVDNIAPASVLKEIAARFGPGRLIQYGPVPYLLTALVYVPALAVMRLIGELGRPSPDYPWGLAHPEQSMTVLVVLARAVSMALGIGLAVLMTRRARRDGLAGAAWIVPLLVLGSPTFMYYARTTNPDVQYVFWLVLGFHFLEQAATRVRWLAAAAGAAALAIATKDQAFPLAFTVIGAAAFEARLARGDRDGTLTEAPRQRWLPPLLVLLTALAAYVIVWRLPFNLSGWLRHAGCVADFDQRRFAFDLPGVVGIAGKYLKLAPIIYGWPMLIGLIAAVALRRGPRGLKLRAIACGLYAIAMLSIGYARPRFGLPLLVLILPVATAGVPALIDRVRAAPRLVRATALATAVLLVAAGGPRLSAAMLSDPRLTAERWMRSHVFDTDTVEIGGNPHFQARVPATIRRCLTAEDSLFTAPRQPTGAVVLISSLDRFSFERDPLLRRMWWNPLLDATSTGRYRGAAVFDSPPFAADLTVLPVAPTVWVFARRELHERFATGTGARTPSVNEERLDPLTIASRLLALGAGAFARPYLAVSRGPAAVALNRIGAAIPRLALRMARNYIVHGR